MDSVIGDRSGDKEAFADKGELQDRFQSLKYENTGLLTRQKLLEQEMIESQKHDQNRILELKNSLYREQKKM